MEWQWNFWFNVSANKSLRFELWEASSIFGHTLLAQGMLDVSNVAIDTLAPTTRIEVCTLNIVLFLYVFLVYRTTLVLYIHNVSIFYFNLMYNELQVQRICF